MRERLGFLPSSRATGSGGIWFHAVSVGEVLSSVELIRSLRTQRPHSPIYLSTTTLTGRATAEQRLNALVNAIFFVPLDYRSAVRRALRRLRPSAVVILETEIWPNLYRESKRAGASLVVVNGRISDRALPRYRAFRWFFRHALAQPDAIFVQSEEDRRRYLIAGAHEARLHVAGNLKFDFGPPTGIASEIASFLFTLRPQVVWIAASTMPPINSEDPDEDDAVLRAFQDLAARFPSLLLILAPRRPERFEVAAGKLSRSAIRFVRRTRFEPLELPGVLLLDSIGELAALFDRATVVFMGGTLASHGGHNILEPAYFGKPVIAGPHMENFSSIAEEFSSARALIRITNKDELAPAVARLLQNSEEASRVGKRARDLATTKRGAVERIACEILNASDRAIPDPKRTLLARVCLTPLSWIWRTGNWLNIAKGLSNSRSLRARVVSVGSLTMGGAGKSPVVAHLALRFTEQGRNVGILTRGYRRRSQEDVIVIRKGDTAPVAVTGDEVQTFIRAGCAHIGVGKDRFRVGQRIEATLAPDVFLLDDGFQHVRLKRDEDIVLIDALDPLAGGVFPLGRRRESLESLARATAVIVTRVEPGQPISGIERIIRRYNPTAPIFVSRVVPKRWRAAFSTRETLVSLPAGPVAAFCGLGKPRSFWRTLDLLEIPIAFRSAFSDHHAYRPAELGRLAAQASEAGATALVTTEKDVMNLPSNAEALLQPHKLLWLEIGIEIDNEADLLRRIL